MSLRSPARDEYHEYYWTYVSKVPEGDILQILEDSFGTTEALLNGLPADKGTYRYAPGKWTICELMGHILDTERLFAYRALSMARNDPAELPGMDQDIWADNCNAGNRSLTDLVDELGHVRRANIAMFRGFADDVWDRKGIASDVSFTVRSFPYILAGHEIHHRQVIEERYLS